jgi:hypothetical protein
MENIKGVLKHPLTMMKSMSTKDRNMWKKDGAPPLRLWLDRAKSSSGFCDLAPSILHYNWF